MQPSNNTPPNITPPQHTSTPHPHTYKSSSSPQPLASNALDDTLQSQSPSFFSRTVTLVKSIYNYFSSLTIPEEFHKLKFAPTTIATLSSLYYQFATSPDSSSKLPWFKDFQSTLQNLLSFAPSSDPSLLKKDITSLLNLLDHFISFQDPPSPELQNAYSDIIQKTSNFLLQFSPNPFSSLLNNLIPPNDLTKILILYSSIHNPNSPQSTTFKSNDLNNFIASCASEYYYFDNPNASTPPAPSDLDSYKNLIFKSFPPETQKTLLHKAFHPLPSDQFNIHTLLIDSLVEINSPFSQIADLLPTIPQTFSSKQDSILNLYSHIKTILASTQNPSQFYNSPIQQKIAAELSSLPNSSPLIQSLKINKELEKIILQLIQNPPTPDFLSHLFYYLISFNPLDPLSPPTKTSYPNNPIYFTLLKNYLSTFSLPDHHFQSALNLISFTDIHSELLHKLLQSPPSASLLIHDIFPLALTQELTQTNLTLINQKFSQALDLYLDAITPTFKPSPNSPTYSLNRSLLCQNPLASTPLPPLLNQSPNYDPLDEIFKLSQLILDSDPDKDSKIDLIDNAFQLIDNIQRPTKEETDNAHKIILNQASILHALLKLYYDEFTNESTLPERKNQLNTLLNLITDTLAESGQACIDRAETYLQNALNIALIYAKGPSDSPHIASSLAQLFKQSTLELALADPSNPENLEIIRYYSILFNQILGLNLPSDSSMLFINYGKTLKSSTALFKILKEFAPEQLISFTATQIESLKIASPESYINSLTQDAINAANDLADKETLLEEFSRSPHDKAALTNEVQKLTQLVNTTYPNLLKDAKSTFYQNKAIELLSSINLLLPH